MPAEIIAPYTEIMHPNVPTVVIGPETDFAYIMRKDTVPTMQPIAIRIAEETGKPTDSILPQLSELYDTFYAELADMLLSAYSHKGNVELHLYDDAVLESGVRKNAGNLPVISLDPLMTDGVTTFAVSRGYHPSGTADFGQVGRPGWPGLPEQAKAIAAAFGNQPVALAEDDVFSGGSLIRSLNALQEAGVHIGKIVTGIQVGDPKKLDAYGIPIDPVVRYATPDGTDIFDKVDLGDPRDYLLGASGLVVKLPDGTLGRMSYLLPGVSTSARAGIPKDTERAFSAAVLSMNRKFFLKATEATGAEIRLKHMDPAAAAFFHTMLGTDMETPMAELTEMLIEHIDEIWEGQKVLGHVSEALMQLELPKNLVFLDVNGTILTDDAANGEINPDDLVAFQTAVLKLKGKGITVGLNSDSPEPMLAAFAEKLGIPGAPIIAENGAVVSHRGRQITLVTPPDITAIKSKIAAAAEAAGYSQADDVTAPEFGGTAVPEGSWAFGKGRLASVSVFGPADIIATLGELMGETPTIDCSPQWGSMSIHGQPIAGGKARTLSILAGFGHRVMMVGNSKSDWTDPENGVTTAYVGGSRLTPEIAGKAVYISDKPTIAGVTDILGRII